MFIVLTLILIIQWFEDIVVLIMMTTIFWKIVLKKMDFMKGSGLDFSKRQLMVIAWTFLLFGISGLEVVVRTVLTIISMPEKLRSYLILEYHRFVALAIVNFLQSMTILYLF